MASVKNGRHQTCLPSNMAAIKHGRHQTWAPSNMGAIKHGRHQTWPPSNMAAIKHGRHQTWPPSNMATIRRACQAILKKHCSLKWISSQNDFKLVRFDFKALVLEVIFSAFSFLLLSDIVGHHGCFRSSIKIGPLFSSFNSLPSLAPVTTDNRKQFQLRKVVFNNKTRP